MKSTSISFSTEDKVYGDYTEYGVRVEFCAVINALRVCCFDNDPNGSLKMLRTYIDDKENIIKLRDWINDVIDAL